MSCRGPQDCVVSADARLDGPWQRMPWPRWSRRWGSDGGDMDPAEREPRMTIEELTSQLVSGTIDRRTFLRRGTMLAVSLPTLSAIIAACSSPAPPGAATATPGGGGQSDKPVIAFLLRNKLQARWDFDEAGFIAEAEKLGVPYATSFTAGDTQEFQNAKAEAMLAAGTLKALVLVP